MTADTALNSLLAQDSYNDHQLHQIVTIAGVDFKVFDQLNDPVTGYQGVAYQRVGTDEIVIAHRGTEQIGRDAILTDGGMVLTGLNVQATDALRFTQRVIDSAKADAELNHRPLEITVTGHSLGGTLAQITAHRFGLQGETFNAYGAAGLMQGLPRGGHQVVNHVRATDVVSAASAHFGEVRTYAVQQDIDALGRAGYRDDGGLLSARNPIKASDVSAHGIDNFVPDSKLLGNSIVSPENEARYRAHHGMIDRYRNDIHSSRTLVSAPWEISKTAIEAGVVAGKATVNGVQVAGKAVGQALDTVGDGASRAYETLRHPSSWFDGKTPAPATPEPRLDQPTHPDHAMFKQAQTGVQRLDAQNARAPDQRSDQLAAALVVAARGAGMSRIDRVELSTDTSKVFAVQGPTNSPFKQIASVPTVESLNMPIAQSSQALQQLTQQKAAEQQPPQQHTQPQAQPYLQRQAPPAM